jgi:glucosylceramidase
VGRPSAHGCSLRALAAALVLSIAALAVPAQASASKLSRRPVSALTAAERSAVSVASLSAVGDEPLGLIVTVTFNGNVERYLGQGNLSAGLLALTLSPASGGGGPIGLVDAGGGFASASFPLVKRHGKRVTVRAGAVQVFGNERLLRMLTPGQVNVFRAGRRVIFYLGGLGLSQPVNVKLKAFSRSPTGPNSWRSGVQALTASVWHKVVQTRPTAVASMKVSPSQLTVAQLEALQGQLSGTLSRGLQPELRREQQAQIALKSAISHYRTLSRRLRVSRAVLGADLRRGAAGVAHLKTKIAQLNRLIALVGAQISATTAPPVSVVQTDPGLGQEMATQPGLVTSTIKPQGVPVIDVNEGVRYQQFGGLGAALPDSSAWLIYDELPSPTRQALLQALFGQPAVQNALGVPAIGLNFLRVAIGASGAMTVGPPYSYDDLPPGRSDPTLSSFSIAHDEAYIIPTLQQALAANPSLKILANPWSPPGWMKSNGSLDNPDGQATLLDSAYGPLAKYFVKFIQAYQGDGIPIDAITPQNEPSSGQVSTAYPGLTLPEGDEAQFVAQDLEPALHAAGLSPKIYGSDLSWDSLSYASALGSGPAAGDLSGISWHCYFGSPTVMSQLHQASPGLDQIVNECSPEIRPVGTPEFLISSLRNWASVVTVWALALDPNGGPIQPGNDCPGCTGPVAINEQTGAVTFRPEYYQLGQVSAFVQPGAWRIDSPAFVTYGVNGANGFETAAPGLDDVTFQNPDGSKVLVAYNNTGAPLTFGVESDGHYFTYTLPARAMTTFVWH